MRSFRRKHIQKARREQARKLLPPRFGWPILLLLLTVSAPVIIRIGSHELIHKRKNPLLAAEWKIYSPGQSRLSLLLPGAPQTVSVKTPAADPAVRQVDRYQTSVKEFRVAVWNISYHGEIPADLRKAAEGVAAALKESGEVIDYQETVIPTRRYGRSGMLVSGAFKRNGEERQFRALLLGEGDRLWQVVVDYPSSYSQASSASQRIIDSVRMN